VVAVTLTPALSLLLYSRGAAHRESPLLAALRPRYDRLLGRFLEHPRIVLGSTLGCVVVAAAALALLDAKPVPTFKDRNVIVRLDGAPGTSIERMRAIAAGVSRELRGIAGVENGGAHVGRAVTGDARVDVNSAEVWASLSPDADHDAVVGRIEDVVAGVRGVDHDVGSYTADRIRAVGALDQGVNDASGDGLQVLTGTGSPLVTRVYGHDPAVLAREAERIRGVMTRIDGVVDPRIERPVDQPNLVIEVDLARAQRLGIKPGDVRRAEATLLQGIQAGSVFEDQKVFDVLVVGAPQTRQSIADVRNLLIDRPGGGHVRLGRVADVRIEPTAVAIDREAVSRHLDVSAGVGGRGVDDVADDIRTRLAAMSFPLEYHAEVLELTTSDEIGLLTILAFVIVAAIAALLLMQAAFRSWRLAAAACLLLAAALAGGPLAALIAGGDLALGSMIGLLVLLGLAARTTVLSVCHLQGVARGANGGFGPALVRRGAGERLKPVLGTAAGIVAIALPIVALGTRPGLEIVEPAAVVLLGGIVTGVFTSLFALPGLYLRYGAGATLPSDWDQVRVTQFEGVQPDPEPDRPASRS
jgi:Cu/Ag efflux pump CusA